MLECQQSPINTRQTTGSNRFQTAKNVNSQSIRLPQAYFNKLLDPSLPALGFIVSIGKGVQGLLDSAELCQGQRHLGWAIGDL